MRGPTKTTRIGSTITNSEALPRGRDLTGSLTSLPEFNAKTIRQRQLAAAKVEVGSTPSFLFRSSVHEIPHCAAGAARCRPVRRGRWPSEAQAFGHRESCCGCQPSCCAAPTCCAPAPTCCGSSCCQPKCCRQRCCHTVTAAASLQQLQQLLRCPELRGPELRCSRLCRSGWKPPAALPPRAAALGPDLLRPEAAANSSTAATTAIAAAISCNDLLPADLLRPELRCPELLRRLVPAAEYR